MRRTLYSCGLLTAFLMAPVVARADGHCARCGTTEPCQKVCRLVVEDKKVDVVCWGAKCEDFSVPGPSRPGCQNCESVCGSTDGSTCAAPKKFVWTDWTPGSAQAYSRKKLMKKTVSKTVPSHKWVVEDLCHQCEATSEGATVVPGVLVPPPPVADAKLKFRK
jgi:hypothetical protein